jgi:hypothetical protein
MEAFPVGVPQGSRRTGVRETNHFLPLCDADSERLRMNG